MSVASQNDASSQGFVNFVDVRWKSLGDRYPDNQDDMFDPIDKRTDNVGRMMVAATMIDTDRYDAAVDFAGGSCHFYYLRPLRTVFY